MEKGVAGKIDEVPRIDLLKAKQEVDEIIAKK
jgi:hypothetical protein